MAIRINRVYTRGGDTGETSLVGGQRIAKDAVRIESYGTVDELNAVVGLARTANRRANQTATGMVSSGDRARIERILERIQSELFNLGSDLATLPADRHPRQPVIERRHVQHLEKTIDALNGGLPELNSFVLPGGGEVSALLHQARTVCRRAERIVTTLARVEVIGAQCLVYLNRLSDLFFVLSRFASRAYGEEETLWDPSAER